MADRKMAVENIEGVTEKLPDSARGRYVKRLLAAYRGFYNITPAEDLPGAGRPEGLLCRCDLDMKNAQYVLSRKNELWSAESHEYAYVFTFPRLYEDLYRELESYVYEEGMKLIHPGKGHMCSILTLLVVCDECTPEAEKLLKKCRIHKNFRMSLDGWMDFHTALAVVKEKAAPDKAVPGTRHGLFGRKASGRVATNSSGHENAKLMKQLLPKAG